MQLVLVKDIENVEYSVVWNMFKLVTECYVINSVLFNVDGRFVFLEFLHKWKNDDIF